MLGLWRFFGNTVSSLLGGRRKKIINGFWVAGGGAGLTGLEHLCEDLETYVSELWRREVVSAVR